MHGTKVIHSLCCSMVVAPTGHRRGWQATELYCCLDCRVRRISCCCFPASCAARFHAGCSIMQATSSAVQDLQAYLGPCRRACLNGTSACHPQPCACTLPLCCQAGNRALPDEILGCCVTRPATGCVRAAKMHHQLQARTHAALARACPGAGRLYSILGAGHGPDGQPKVGRP